jgi:hypothetical protein
VYVYVYVCVPEQAGAGEITGAETVNVLPQLSNTVGGVGATAAVGQATVVPAFAGIVTVGALIVYV